MESRVSEIRTGFVCIVFLRVRENRNSEDFPKKNVLNSDELKGQKIGIPKVSENLDWDSYVVEGQKIGSEGSKRLENFCFNDRDLRIICGIKCGILKSGFL